MPLPGAPPYDRLNVGRPRLIDPIWQIGVSDDLKEIENFEAGSNGAAFGLSDGIIDSGTDGGGANGSWIYSNEFPRAGSLGTKLEITVGSSWSRQLNVGPDGALGAARDDCYMQAAVRFSTVTPGVTVPFMQARRSDATVTAQAQIALVDGGIFRIRNPFTGVGDLATPALPNTDYIFQWRVNQRTQTQQVRLYGPGGALLEETAPLTFTGLAYDQFTHGALISPVNVPFTAWFDWIGYRTGDWPTLPAPRLYASASSQVGLSDSIARSTARAVSATSFVGLFSVAAGVKRAPAVTSAQAGLASSSIGVDKVAKAGTTSAAGLASSAVVRKVGRAGTTTPTGLASSATVRKVAPGSAVGRLGLASSAAGRKVAPAVTTAALGLSDSIVRSLARAVSATSFVGLSSSGVVRKTAKAAAVGSVGLASSSTAVKRLPAATSTPVGLSAAPVARKVAPGAAAGRLGLASTVSAAKRLPTASVAALGLASSALGRRVARGGTSTPVGLASTGGAAKRAPVAALAALGLSDRVVRSLARAVSVLTSIGLASSGPVRKVAVARTSTPAGLASAVAARKVSPAAAVAALGLVGTGAGRKVARTGAVGSLGVSASTVARKVAPGTARGCVGLAAVGGAGKRIGVSTRTPLGLVVQRDKPNFTNVDFTVLGLIQRWDVQLMMAAPWAIGLDHAWEVAAPTMGALVLGYRLELSTGDLRP
jgi:hypothetical protein